MVRDLRDQIIMAKVAVQINKDKIDDGKKDNQKESSNERVAEKNNDNNCMAGPTAKNNVCEANPNGDNQSKSEEYKIKKKIKI